MVSLRNSSGGRLNGRAGEQATEASNDKGGPRKIALMGNATVRILAKARAKEDAQGNFPAQTSFYGARRQRYTRQSPDADLFFPLT